MSRTTTLESGNEAATAWAALFGDGRALGTITLAGGVGLQSIETFIGSTLLPSVVRDIGGLELFAWNATVFIVASIVASIFAAVRPLGLGPRSIYVLAAIGFGCGSLICGLSPTIEVLLCGRALQGFGAGLLTAVGYSMIRLVFPDHLWGRAFGLISTVWGIATLVGPAIGGVFADFHAWRLAFFVLVPCAIVLAILALRALPRTGADPGMRSVPLVQILLAIGAVAAMSVASVVTTSNATPALLIAGALAFVVTLALCDRNGSKRLFPSGTFVWGTALASLFATMILLNSAIVCDMFVPLFLQRLHGLTPLSAGYMVALTAVGWSAGSIIASNWTGTRERVGLVLGPCMQLAGLLGLFLCMSRGGTTAEVLLPIGISLLLLGGGVGIAWPNIEARLLHAAPPGEADVTAAAISMAQLFSSGFSAAIAGLIVNLAGLASQDLSRTASSATWLYGLFSLIPLLTIPLAWSIASRRRKRTGAAA